MPKPIVAIVGRPNVGKSTLFNRLIGQPMAIVEDEPGTTRDRIYGDAEWIGTEFVVVDTGGLDLLATDDLLAQIRAQAQEAIAEADVILFLTSAQDGLMANDYEVAELLRRTAKPVLLVVNKADNDDLRLAANEFYELGLDNLIAVSSLHGIGTGDLLDLVVDAIADLPEGEALPADIPKIAIVGRPNVGKSSLLNALLGRERAIVSSVPGTTRDALDTPLEWNGEEIVLIDTAGIRRRGRIEPGVEKYSVLRALRAIGRADVVLLLIDGTEGITSQDAHVASYILDEKKSVVVVVNKWDIVPKDAHTMDQYREYARYELRFLPYVPILFVSALTGQRVEQTVETALRVHEARFERIPTGDLNDLVREAVSRHAPPSKWGKRLTFYYATQPEVNPPTFVFFVNDARLVHFGYRRYLENRIRELYPFEGTPLLMRFKGHELD
jgi:GTP-binding protein